MLHAKFYDHRSSGSGEDFLRFLPYMGMAKLCTDNDGRTTDARPCVSYKLTMSLWLRRAKNNVYPCKPQFVGCKGIKITRTC